MEYLDIIFKIAALLGIGGVVGVILKHYLSGTNRSQIKRQAKLNELDANIKLLQDFGRQIMELEVEILELRRKDGENSDTLQRLTFRYNELRLLINQIKSISDEELKELEEKLNEIQLMLEVYVK